MIDRRYQQAPWQSNLPATPSTSAWGGANGNLVGDGTTPHVKGPYETLLTATYDVYGFWVCVAGVAVSGSQTDMMLDLATGASQENIIVPELLVGYSPILSNGCRMFYMPIFLPKGTVLSGRIQSLILSDIADVLIFANGAASAQSGPLFTGCDAYGTVQASSQGTSHTPGNSGAESTAVNLGATLTKNYGAVMLVVQGTMSATTTSSLTYHWELVLGGTTLAEWLVHSTLSEAVFGPYPPTPIYRSLPSGSQLQVQAECSGTGQAHDVAFYCFY